MKTQKIRFHVFLFPRLDSFASLEQPIHLQFPLILFDKTRKQTASWETPVERAQRAPKVFKPTTPTRNYGFAEAGWAVLDYPPSYPTT